MSTLGRRAIASIITPSRGGRERLQLLARHLAAQERDDFEWIVVLDGDIDDSRSVLDEVKDLPLQVITFAENQGRSAALNAGHVAARGDVLIRCDDDLAPDPSYVSNHVLAHEDARLGAIGLCRNVYPATAYSRAYGVIQDMEFRREAYATPPGGQWKFWAGNVSATREAWSVVGPYDTGFRAYGWEDVDWGYRLHLAGWQVRCVPTLETDHHVAATTTQIRVRRAYASGAARARFLDKHTLDLPQSDHGLWARGVQGAARLLDDGGLARAARVVDAVADRVPRPVAHKMVALLVESAALSGLRRRPDYDATLT